jgi:hypothetical protein
VKQPPQLIARRALIAGLAILFLSGALLGARAWPQLPSELRADAQQRWATRPFAAYRVALRIEYWNRVCFQELEVHGELVRRVVSDTCLTSSFSMMTVPRLYEMSQRLEQAPSCYPDGQPCACRLRRIGKIEYDARLGYPRQIVYRREALPNWTHLDFWRHLWLQRDLPTCGTSRTLRIAVISFVPLP